MHDTTTECEELRRRLYQKIESLAGLSVRSRNCLIASGTHYLGDLIQRKERDVSSVRSLGSKSFGEIRKVIQRQGFKLGMNLPNWREADSVQLIKFIHDNGLERVLQNRDQCDAIEESIEDRLFQRIDSMGLSVRSLKCLNKLGVVYVGDLVAKHEHELMRTKNFGSTSLQEIQVKLSEMGLKLGMDLLNWRELTYDKRVELHNLERSKELDSGERALDEIDESIVLNLLQRIDDMDLSVRSLKCLSKLEIVYVGDLVSRRGSELLRIKNFGRKSFKEIETRLGEMSLKLGVRYAKWPPENIEVLLQKYASELERVRIANMKKRYPSMDGQLITLEDELECLINYMANTRNRDIIKSYLGLCGNGGKTLETVGKEFGITRERVRQIVTSFEELLIAKRLTFYTPVLEQIFKLIENRVPIEKDKIEQRILGENLTKSRFDLSGLLNIARLLEKSTTIRIVKVGKTEIVLSSNQVRLFREIANAARRDIGCWGISTISNISKQLSERIEQSLPEETIISFLSLFPDLVWLDKEGGWFCLIRSFQKSNIITSQIRKILTVSDRIRVSDLRSGIARHHRLDGFAPPRRVLIELCKQIPWCNVEGDLITGRSGENINPIFTESEEIIYGVLSENGFVLTREKLEEICLERGINRHTLDRCLTRSPIISKFAPGIYGVRGARIHPSLVESLKTSVAAHKVIRDYGWTKDRKIWIVNRISRSILDTGIFPIPSAMKKFIQGEFELKTADGSVVGTIKIKDYSGWGLSRLFKILGGDIGDYLAFLFAMTSRTVEVYIGDEDVMDDLMSSDFVVSRESIPE